MFHSSGWVVYLPRQYTSSGESPLKPDLASRFLFLFFFFSFFFDHDQQRNSFVLCVHTWLNMYRRHRLTACYLVKTKLARSTGGLMCNDQGKKGSKKACARSGRLCHSQTCLDDPSISKTNRRAQPPISSLLVHSTSICYFGRL